MTTEGFLNEANKKWIAKGYEYDMSNWVNLDTKLNIKCTLHGTEFQQKAWQHLKRSACRGCSRMKWTTEQVVIHFIETHGSLYDYSKVLYRSATDKVTIVCNIHGEFQQTHKRHKEGQACPMCSGRAKKTSHIVQEFINVHGKGKFDWSEVKYKGPLVPVTVICNEHGPFSITPRTHITGKKHCPSCYNNPLLVELASTLESRCKHVHGEKYEYKDAVYLARSSKIVIACPKHGNFRQRVDNHLSGKGCPKCAATCSKQEQEVRDFIHSLGLRFKVNCRQTISPKEIDIVIESHKLAIEYNGLYWHSKKGKNYHANKTESCKLAGFRLIHIFEDEWLEKRQIVESRIRNILGLSKNKIGARQCTIKQIGAKECNAFLVDNHIQGSVGSKHRLGLFYKETLVSVMSFGNHRSVLGSKSKIGQYELLRFAVLKHSIVHGAASRMFAHFCQDKRPEQIISYADKRWSIGSLYETLGFTWQHDSKPNYFYVIGQQRKHRAQFMKHKLVKSGADPNMTEKEIMLKKGIDRVYDSGHSVWVKQFSSVV